MTTTDGAHAANEPEGGPVRSGDLEVHRVDCGTERERLVVLRADPYVLASREAVAEMVRHDNPYVSYRDGRVTFGTAGEGAGVVTYQILGEATASIPDGRHDLPAPPVVETPTIEIRRVEST